MGIKHIRTVTSILVLFRIDDYAGASERRVKCPGTARYVKYQKMTMHEAKSVQDRRVDEIRKPEAIH